MEENSLQKKPGMYSVQWNAESDMEIIPVTDVVNAGLCPVSIAMCFQIKRLMTVQTISGVGKF